MLVLGSVSAIRSERARREVVAAAVVPELDYPHVSANRRSHALQRHGRAMPLGLTRGLTRPSMIIADNLFLDGRLKGGHDSV